MSFKLTIFSGERGINPLDDNVDVEVEMNDGRIFSVTFFTVENIKSLLRRYRETGECANGLYMWATDMIIVDRLTEEVIQKSIDNLIKNGEISHVCTELTRSPRGMW